VQVQHTPQDITPLSQATRTQQGIIHTYLETRTQQGIIHTYLETITQQAVTTVRTTQIRMFIGQITTQRITAPMCPLLLTLMDTTRAPVTRITTEH
jgi:hypothetical protein